MVFLILSDTADAGKKNYNWKLVDKANKDLSICIKNRDKKTNLPSHNRLAGVENEYSLCVEKIIIKVADEFYAPDAFGEGGIKARIKEMERPYRDIYGSIVMKAGACGPPECGSMWEPYSASSWGIQLEKMLSEMIYHLKSIRQHK